MAQEFVLLRLTPGPAEALFGITAAPMAAIADWHGRVQRPNFDLRGDIPGACARLKAAHREFDVRAARRPPYAVPEWAAPLVQPEGEPAMLAHLEQIHPTGSSGRVDKKELEPLAEVYRSLDIEGDLLAFCANYVAACAARAPEYGTEYPGYAAEVELLEEMTRCRNDRIKFEAIEGYGRFAPVGSIGFFAERAAKRAEGCNNPNVVLCRCLDGIALTVARYPGPETRESLSDYREILDTLPFLVEVLDTEGRNNGACASALEAIRTIAERTGAPEALEAYLHDLNPPTPDSEWLADYTRKALERNHTWLVEQTGEDFGFDYEAWQAWYRKQRSKLFRDADEGRFVIDAAAAKVYRKKVGGK